MIGSTPHEQGRIECEAYLRKVAWFTELPDADLARLAMRSERVVLPTGAELFSQGDPGDRAYVIASGELEVRVAGPGRPVVLAVRGPGEVVGEMALLRGAPRSASVAARTDATLYALAKSDLDALLSTRAPATLAVLHALLDRWEETQGQLGKLERLAQLGTLTAGVAHELNNPVGAIGRTAARLGEAIGRLEVAARRAEEQGTEADEVDRLILSAGPSPYLDPLARNDLETAIEARLEDLGVGEGWRLAPELVEAGLGPEHLDVLQPPSAPVMIELVAARTGALRLAAEIQVAADRISGIVAALRSQTYLDRAPVQEVDVVVGIEETLVLLDHVLRGIEVVRDYASDLPAVTGSGGELNQVWTNLIANAADAGPSRIVLRAFSHNGAMTVEVEDDGAGIPAEIQPRIFDAFFTTKPPGQGTGLGLAISQRIIVLGHGGSLTVESEPGKTLFRVEVPLAPAGTGST